LFSLAYSSPFSRTISPSKVKLTRCGGASSNVTHPHGSIDHRSLILCFPLLLINHVLD
jgi:hypothetical protein